MSKPQFKFRDLLAAPFVLIALLTLWFALYIGSAWTATRFTILKGWKAKS